MNVDITERKRAEEALRDSEQRYRTLTESTRDIIYIVDREGTAIYANQTASTYTGLNTTDIVGKRQADLFPPEMAATHVARVERVSEPARCLKRMSYFTLAREEVWLRIHLVPLRDDAGQITSVMGVCHNITDRKRAEAALKEGP